MRSVPRPQATRVAVGAAAVGATIACAVFFIRSQTPDAPPPFHPPLRAGVLVDTDAQPERPGPLAAAAPVTALAVTEYHECPTTSVTGPCAVYTVPGAGLITYDLSSKCMRHAVPSDAGYGFEACDHRARLSARGIAPGVGY